MIVHLVGSLRDIEKDLSYLRSVVEIIHDFGGVLAHNWLEHDIIRQREALQTPDWTPYVEANLEAVKRADIVIVDASHHAFTQGFLVAAALEHKKPTLIISRKPLKGTSVSGIANTLITAKTYTDTIELQSIVKSFIEQNTVHTKDLRFNIFLTRNIFKYLEDTTRETGKNRSQIVREVIMRKIKKRAQND